MKRFIALALIGVIAASLSFDADAQRRLGGGRTLGKQSPQVQQRQATPPEPQAPAQQAAPAQQTPATAPRATSPWKGALLGLAAGLGLAALAAHFGLSDTLTSLVMAAVVAFAVLALVGFVIRRIRGSAPRPAYDAAGRGAYAPQAQSPQLPPPVQRSSLDLTAGARPGSAMDEFARAADTSPAQPWGVPAGFDTDGFLRHAKDYFSKLQGAWDRGNLGELEEFTTHDMFVALTHELRARGAGSRTEVLTLDAALLGIESTAAEHLASVRFSGSLRVDGEIEQVDEVWNLSKPIDGTSGWLLAGIQQLS
jgi:predicted lipid-binding transport protein (Tim44 family)